MQPRIEITLLDCDMQRWTNNSCSTRISAISKETIRLKTSNCLFQ